MKNHKQAIDNAYIYGRSPNPTTWHEAADVIRKRSKSKRQSGLAQHLEDIKRLLQDRNK